MDLLFLQILNMSILASFVIVAVIILRFFIRNLPKCISYTLWSVVLFRLVCPFSFESMISLLPTAMPLPHEVLTSTAPTINSGFRVLDTALSLPAPTIGDRVNPMQQLIYFGALIWAVGIAALIIYSLASYLCLLHRVRFAVKKQDNIYECAAIESPFVLGAFRPKIYLPANLSQIKMLCIIKHEQAHIKRLDTFIKPLAYLVLCVHWFNPFCWLAFALFSRDMELSCDEAVLKAMGSSFKKEYTSALLALAEPRKAFCASPLAFGEGNVRSRIKNVLNYKRPSFWVILLAVIATVIIALCLLTNPIKENALPLPQSSRTIENSVAQGEAEPITGKEQRLDEITSLDDWNSFNYDRLISDNAYNFFYNLLSGKSEIEEYNTVKISEFKISYNSQRGDGIVYLNFDFTVTSSGLTALPMGEYHKIVADIVDCYLQDDIIGTYEDSRGEFKGIEEVDMVANWINSIYAWDCPEFGDNSDVNLNYLVAQYGNGSQLAVTDFVRLAKEKFGATVTDLLQYDSLIFEDNGVSYITSGGIGGSSAYKVINATSSGDNADVTVQLYADCNLLIPSHIVEYHFKKGGIWMGYTLVKQAAHEPYFLRKAYS